MGWMAAAGATFLAVACCAADAASQSVEPASAVLAAPVLTGEQLAEQNRVNREFYRRVADGPQSASGLWNGTLPEDTDFAYVALPDGSFSRSFFELQADGTVKPSIEGTYRFDDSTGTVAVYDEGQLVHWIRVQKLDADTYRVRAQEDSRTSVAEAEAKRATYAFTGDSLIITRSDLNHYYKWAPQPAARKPFASASEIQAASPARLERWGALGKMAGKRWIAYGEGTQSVSDTFTSGWDWIEAGEALRSWVQSSKGAREVTGESRWNDQENRIDQFDSSGKLVGQATVDPNGDVEYQRGQFHGRLVGRNDGSYASSIYDETSGWTTYLLFEDTPAGRQLAHQAKWRDKRAADEAAAAKERARREEESAKTDRFLAAMGGLQQALSEIDDRYDAAKAAESQGTSASVSGTPTGAGEESSRDVSAPKDSTDGAGAPLRFVLDIGLQPRAGDTVNPTCYSNVITRPGPPGWGRRGFLPTESARSARAAVNALKSAFIEACRSASGREITSEGNFHWTWNETQDGDSQVSNAGAQYREDVTVQL